MTTAEIAMLVNRLEEVLLDLDTALDRGDLGAGYRRLIEAKSLASLLPQPKQRCRARLDVRTRVPRS